MVIQENLQHWLTDEKARDQFVIRAGSDTEVLWNDARQLKADPVYKRNVSESFLDSVEINLFDFVNHAKLSSFLSQKNHWYSVEDNDVFFALVCYTCRILMFEFDD